MRDRRVAVSVADGAPAEWYCPDRIAAQLTEVAVQLGWGVAANPFCNVVQPGARVVVKPNWVMDRNHGPWGWEALITHPSLVSATSERLLLTGAAEVRVGDAPLQSCNFRSLLEQGELRSWAARLQQRDRRFAGIRDFRRTRSAVKAGVLVQETDVGDEADYIPFDLGTESYLEPVATKQGEFRVTQYDPKHMSVTHGPGRHCYLIARDILDADIVINLPKLKMHKKAGVTSALKNVVGINGNKEFLPHHRKGGTYYGGDCYPGQSRLKQLQEVTLDALNSTQSYARRAVLGVPVHLLALIGRATGDRVGVEGAWSGNDTVWRMVLDLNRILYYGRADGSLSDAPQRRVLSIVDGLVAGQGDGPLAPEPFALGVMLAGETSAAIDWIAAELLGFEPSRIPTIAGAFGGEENWPLTSFDPLEIQLRVVSRRQLSTVPLPDRYPAGWLDAVRGREAPTGVPRLCDTGSVSNYEEA